MRRKFIIPMNYLETGYVLNGAVAIRNAIEGGLLAVLGYFICQVLPFPKGMDGISYYILICGPLFLIGVAGIQGDPISVFIMNYFKWRKRQKPCFYSTHGEAYTQEAADAIMTTTSMRDLVTDVVLSLRGKFTAEEVDYVEGETFEFAEDPEQAALRQAQKDLLEKRMKENEKRQVKVEEEEVEILELVEESPAPVKVPEGEDIDADRISKEIRLDELRWEENG